MICQKVGLMGVKNLFNFRDTHKKITSLSLVNNSLKLH